jgi:hypothetical protein
MFARKSKGFVWWLEGKIVIPKPLPIATLLFLFPNRALGRMKRKLIKALMNAMDHFSILDHSLHAHTTKRGVSF